MKLGMVLCGMSASGKTTVLNDLVENNEFYKLITNTTRNIREGETADKDYFFLKKEDFKKNWEEGNMLEMNIIKNNFYGLGNNSFDKIPNNKKGLVIVEPNGAKNIKLAQEKQGWKILTVYIDESIETIKNRINARDSGEALKNRLNHIDEIEKEWINEVDWDFVTPRGLTIKDLSKVINNKFEDEITLINKKKSKIRP
jgi:guanylate kinase